MVAQLSRRGAVGGGRGARTGPGGQRLRRVYHATPSGALFRSCRRANRGRYLDDKFFWPILGHAESLGVPIYLHPTQPRQPVVEASYAGFAPEVTFLLANSGRGWHIDTAIHVLRMILGGAFDRYLKLQLIVGHLEESLPFMMSKVDLMSTAINGLNRPIRDYLRENLHYTLGAFSFTAPFLDLPSCRCRSDRVLGRLSLRIDVTGRAFLDQLPVSPRERERIAHGNTEPFLGL